MSKSYKGMFKFAIEGQEESTPEEVHDLLIRHLLRYGNSCSAFDDVVVTHYKGVALYKGEINGT